MNNSNLLYIVSEGRLNGYVHKAYASSYDNLNAVLSDTVYVNKTTQLAVVTLPNNSNPSEWLLVDSNWDVDKIATEDGWVDVDTVTPDPVITVAAWAAKSALARAGLATKVEQAVAAVKTTDYELYYKWHGATTFKSTDPDLTKMAFKLNMSQTDLQNLFVAAKAIEASSS